MGTNKGQGQLFPDYGSTHDKSRPHKGLRLSKELLIKWQEKIHNHQSNLFKGLPNVHQQGSLFTKVERTSIEDFAPLKLIPLPLSFWRWPDAPHDGPAIYLVMDRLEECGSHILLYVGETIAADRRWKGVHDCKAYLASYSEALSSTGIKSQLSIRFWSDVPEHTKSRRAIEQQLIRQWLPPFNKETRARWNTPFTTQLS